MLFKNLKSGNIVAVSNEDSIALMLSSPIYEVVNAEKILSKKSEKKHNREFKTTQRKSEA